MERLHDFSLPVPVEGAWKVLLDLGRVARCMPGATLESAEGDRCSGSVTVQVGPVTVTYRGTARIVASDERAHRAVIEASGEEIGGTGTARARVRAELQDRDGTSELSLVTELSITGEPAQCGPGALADAAGALIDRVAACLADELAGRATVEPLPLGLAPAEAGAAVSPQPTTAAATPRPGADAPIDLYEVASEPIAKRLLPVAGVLAASVLLGWLLRRHRA